MIFKAEARRVMGFGAKCAHYVLADIHPLPALIAKDYSGRDDSRSERRRFFFLVADAPALSGVFRAEPCTYNPACRSKASRKTVGSSLPRAEARRRIPEQALGVK